jgi:hypothetical protein
MQEANPEMLEVGIGNKMTLSQLLWVKLYIIKESL